jgi:hypothetical protein
LKLSLGYSFLNLEFPLKSKRDFIIGLYFSSLFFESSSLTYFKASAELKGFGLITGSVRILIDSTQSFFGAKTKD